MKKYFYTFSMLAVIVAACMLISCKEDEPNGGPTGGDVAVTDVKVSPTTLNLTLDGESKQLTVTIEPSNATNQEVTFESDDEDVATVDEEGNVSPVGEGEATITVTSKADATKSATCVVKVEKSGIPLTSVTLTVAPITASGYLVVRPDAEKELGNSVTFTPEDTTDDTTISWSSDKTAVAEVSADGKVTAKKPGRATITGTVGGFTVTCNIQVPGVVYAYTEDDLDLITMSWTDRDDAAWWVGGTVGSKTFVDLPTFGTALRLNQKFRYTDGSISRWYFPQGLFGATFGASNKIEIDFVYNVTRYRDNPDGYSGHRTILMATGDIMDEGAGFGPGENGGFCFDESINPHEDPVWYYGNWCIPHSKINTGQLAGDFRKYTVSSTWAKGVKSFANDAGFDPETSNGEMGFTSGTGGNGFYKDNNDLNVIHVAGIRFLLTEF